jgi:hypothetical protein
MNDECPEFLAGISITGITRIDVALEGDWNATVKTVWTRDRGFLGFTDIHRSHPNFRPSIELYFDDHWIGIHCYQRRGNLYHFDENYALRIINHVSKETGL